jgi:hypothetical protein
MKRISEALCFLMALVATSVQAAECRVLKPEGTVRYEGECADGLAHGRGRATVPSRSDPNGYYEGQFKNGLLHGEVTYVFARGNLTSTEYFVYGKPVSSKEAFAADEAGRAAEPAWVVASKANTVPAYAQFMKEWPDAPQVTVAQSKLWELAYEPIKRANSIAAYSQYIREWPLAPQASDAMNNMWQLAFDPVKRANTVTAYIQFINEYPASPQSKAARDGITALLEQPIRDAESGYKCEEARQLNSKFAAAGMSSIFDFDSCADKRKFHNVLIGSNPQTMYLAGVKYENDQERSRAKRIYLTIMDRFSEHPMAVKAADRLAGMIDVEAVEGAQAQTRQAVERSRQAVEQANRDAAYRQDRARQDHCSGKSDCMNSCVGLKDSAWSRCYDSCRAQYSGC